MYVCIFLVKVTEWPPIGKIAAHSAYEMFSWYKYLIVSLVFSHLGFWIGSLFLIAPFPDLCLLVLFSIINQKRGLTETISCQAIERLWRQTTSLKIVSKRKNKS